ncbi:hypothetical protein [Maribacter sp. 2307ULW6-5]|uniref:hypothetical protein n=1 Tax=Maribacter sp. 2307ULW6-5 TaxID=3386275 RepID=UPI0039BD3153
MVKKDLDELFQEKFRDFEQMPPERVWHAIEASLNKKKKRPVIPLWWALGGVAAVLMVGLLVVNPFQEDATNNIQVTDVEQTNAPKSNGDKEAGSTAPNTGNTVEDAVVLDNDAEETQGQGPETITANETVKEEKPGAKENDPRQAPKGNRQPNAPKPVQGLAQQAPAKERTSVTQREPALPLAPDNTETTVASTNVDAPKKETESSALLPPKDQAPRNGLPQEQKTMVADAVPEDKDIPLKNDLEEGKKSIFDSMVQEEEAVAEKTKKRWSAGPSIAPVYFNAMGEGSPVHSIFAPNSKTGDINMSYGLAVAYEITDRLSVRSGLHRVDYGYDTNDIAFASSLEASTNGQIDNINYRATARNLVLSSKNSAPPTNEMSNAAVDVTAQEGLRDGVMSQQFGYLEVPMELNYALLDSRFGINLIGGFSSLFLVDNSIGLSTGDLSMEMGDANNINNVNFSTNIGLGMNYRFSQNLRLNIEPMFKYQMNTFSATDGTFRPYTIGVYSGLSFRF